MLLLFYLLALPELIYIVTWIYYQKQLFVFCSLNIIYKKLLFFIHYVGHKGDININLYLMLISKTILKWCGHCNLFVFLFYIGESILLAKVFSICSKCSVFVWALAWCGHWNFSVSLFYIGESILLAKVFSICSKCSVFVWVHPAFAGYVFYIF